MSTPSSPDPSRPGQGDTGGQSPTSEPRGGTTSHDAAGSVTDRLKAPGAQSSGGDTRESEITPQDFQQTHSRSALSEGDEAQRSHTGPATEAVDVQEPRAEDIDPAAARAAERLVSALFFTSFLGVIGFIATYVFWPFQYEGPGWWNFYTPMLGITMLMALGGVGAGAVVWAKRLMPLEEAVQERHPFTSDPADRAATAAALKEGLAQTQIGRRSLLRNTLLLGAGSLALLPIPLLFSLGPYKNKERVLATTGWRPGVRLIRQNGTPIHRNDVQIGGIETVFPDVPRGTKLADSSAMLIRMRPDELVPRPGTEGWAPDGYIVYSAICTHLGCPVKLYEQQTHHLFCPCHQSTFEANRGARVIFGPAARPLPQLPISVDPEGYFVADSDFREPIGPSYWERSV